MSLAVESPVKAPTKKQVQSEVEGLVRKNAEQQVIITLFFVLLIPLISIFSLQSGAINIDVYELITSQLTHTFTQVQQLHLNVLIEIRLPRFMMTFITGMGLAASGAVMQGICRNPLADPGLIGVSSGAAVFAAATLFLSSYWSIPTTALQYLLPFSAFVGAMVVSVIIFKMATTLNGVNTVLLILAGVALNAMANMFLGLLSYLSDDSTLRLITFWTMGSYAGVGWLQLLIASTGIGCALYLFWRLRLPLTLMMTGETQARHHGINTSRVKTLSLYSVAIATGCAVCFTGIVGFIGLVTPHICRLIVGSDLRKLIPISTIAGGCLVALADSIARTIIIPAELPVGIITALLGAPFFMYLLIRQKKELSYA